MRKATITASYNGDNDSVGGTYSYTGDYSGNTDVLLGVPVTVSSVVGGGATVTVTTATAHNLQSGANVTISGCGTTGYNGATAIVVTGANTFTYTNATTGAAGGTPVYTVNYQQVAVSIVRANAVSFAMQSDVPCTVNVNSSGGSGGTVSLAGSVASGQPAIYPLATIAAIGITADVTALYLVNTSSPAVPGTFKLRTLMNN